VAYYLVGIGYAFIHFVNTQDSNTANLLLYALRWESCCWAQSMCSRAVVIIMSRYLCPNSVAH